MTIFKSRIYEYITGEYTGNQVSSTLSLFSKFNFRRFVQTWVYRSRAYYWRKETIHSVLCSQSKKRYWRRNIYFRSHCLYICNRRFIPDSTQASLLKWFCSPLFHGHPLQRRWLKRSPVTDLSGAMVYHSKWSSIFSLKHIRLRIQMYI